MCACGGRGECSVWLCHTSLYSLETGSLSEPGARQPQSKPQKCSCFCHLPFTHTQKAIGTEVHTAMPAFSSVLGDLNSDPHTYSESTLFYTISPAWERFLRNLRGSAHICGSWVGMQFKLEPSLPHRCPVLLDYAQNGWVCGRRCD